MEPGVYPGTKPLSGIKFKGGLQEEYIIPPKTPVAVTNISYIQVGKSKIPVIDIKLGEQSWIDKVTVGTKKTLYETKSIPSNIKTAKGFVGEPGVELFRSLDIKMTNPLAENVAGIWTTGQKSLLYPYLEKVSKTKGASAELQAVASAIKAKQAIKGITFVQRSPVFTEVIEKGILPKEAYVKLLKVRQDLGTNVVGGGSTSIKGQLGKSFFGKETLGDMDTWAEPQYVKQIAERDLAIVKQYRNDAYIEIKNKTNYEIMVPGVKKPITEVHSIKSWPWLREKGFIETVPGVGGTKQRVLSTEKLFIRKLSAAFDKNPLIKLPGELPQVKYAPREVKHAVGAAAIAREASSLMYGRDMDITGMKPSFRKGYDLENFSSSMDKMLESAKGKTKTEIKEYQSAIEQNPLLLKETKQAKVRSYIKENPLIATRLLSEDSYGYKTKSKPYKTSGQRKVEQPEMLKSIVYGVLSGSTKSQKYPINKPTYKQEQKTKSLTTEKYYPIFKPEATNELFKTVYPKYTAQKLTSAKIDSYPIYNTQKPTAKTSSYPKYNAPKTTISDYPPTTPPPTKTPPPKITTPPPTKPPIKITNIITAIPKKSQITELNYKKVETQKRSKRRKKKQVNPLWWEYGAGATLTEAASFVIGSGSKTPKQTSTKTTIKTKKQNKTKRKYGISWVDIAMRNK